MYRFHFSTGISYVYILCIPKGMPISFLWIEIRIVKETQFEKADLPKPRNVGAIAREAGKGKTFAKPKKSVKDLLRTRSKRSFRKAPKKRPVSTKT